jgi:protein-S-isoprenylcysteine O-methyltransferase Ste14
MDALEAVSYVLFISYIFSFLGLTAYASRQAGRSVWLFSKGHEPQAIPALLFRIAFVGGTAWPLLRLAMPDAFHTSTAFVALQHVIFDVLGHSLIAIGAMIAVISQMHMGASWRIGAANGEIGMIVQDGPFAFSRNPVFFGQAILFIGLFLVFPDLVQAGLTLALLVAIYLQVRIEERVLLATLGESYADYCQQVSRWFGFKKL